MTRSNRLYRKLFGAALLLALAAPAALAAQPPGQDTEASSVGARPEGQRGRHGHGERRHRGRHGGDHHARVMRQLNLTEAQEAQIRMIREETRARAEQLRESGDRQATRTQLLALRQESHSRVAAVLTEEQRQQVEAQRTGARSSRVTRRLGRLQAALGLSDSQTARVRQVFEHSASRREAARATGGNVAPEARRAERELVQGELRQILTAEQITQLEAERGQRRGRHRGHRGQARGNR